MPFTYMRNSEGSEQQFSKFTLNNRLEKQLFQLYIMVNRIKSLLEVNQYHDSHQSLIKTL